MRDRTTVLFDWRLTLFGQESYFEALSGALASVGKSASEPELAAISESIDAAKADPAVRALAHRFDSSRDRHREFTMRLFQVAGLDPQLASALYERDAQPENSFPYVDAADVLHEVRARGCRIGVVSDIHFPLKPHFEHHGMGDLVDAYVLSYEHDFQKPEAKAFETALNVLGVGPDETLMVGDNFERDGGAAKAGIMTLILPPMAGRGVRGLESVLRLL